MPPPAPETVRAPVWRCRDRTLDLRRPALVMGILNCTPDSFSDGGRFLDPDRAVLRGIEMIGQGADILDGGGESTRPGAAPVPAAEEARRVEPVIRALALAVRERAGKDPAIVSIDTSKAAVAERALAAGASLVNDVTALGGDVRMAEVVRASGAGAVLMHMRGEPRTMQENPVYGDVVAEVLSYLRERVRAAADAGIPEERLAIDPGIGFGKTLDHNVAILHRLAEFRSLARPVVLGLSRKSFLGQLTGQPADRRLIPGIAAVSFCLTRGPLVLRVHDVAETVEAVRVVSALMRGRPED